VLSRFRYNDLKEAARDWRARALCVLNWVEMWCRGATEQCGRAQKEAQAVEQLSGTADPWELNTFRVGEELSVRRQGAKRLIMPSMQSFRAGESGFMVHP